MVYLATSINESPVIVDKAGAEINDVRGKAVKFDENGGLVLAKAGEVPVGIGIMTNDPLIPANGDVHVQVKDIGLVRTGAELKKGAELGVDANGCFIPATSGVIAAIALEAAVKADVYVKARLVTYSK